MRQGIREKNIRDFEKYAGKLADVINRIHEYNPEANIYIPGTDEIYLFGISNAYKTEKDAVASAYIPSLDSGEFFLSEPAFHG